MKPIDADALKIDMQEYFDNIPVYMPGVFHVIERASTIEPEVRHGRWIMLEPYGTHHTHLRKCSECGEIKAQELTNFCPNCGARMDGGLENEKGFSC